MTLEGKEIWIISPESWGVSLFSKHYYALELAKRGNSVLFIQPGPPTEKPHERITLVQDDSYIKGTNRLPAPLARFIHRLQIRRMMRKHQSTPDIVWIFDDSQRKYFEVFRPAKIIYHLMDKHAAKHLATSAKSADVCIGVTQGIVKSLSEYNAKSLHIPHGYVDYEPTAIQRPVVKEKNTAAFVGNLLLPFLHWPSIFETIEKNADTHFFFIGSFNGGNLNPNTQHKSYAHIAQLKKTTNVTLLGELSPPDVQNFLSQCDLLFYSIYFPKNSGPVEDAHKILTYLGSGKPIVGTSLSAYQYTKDLIYFAESEEHLHSKVAEVLRNKKELSSPDLIEKRRGFALNHLYSEHIKRIEDIL